MENVIGLKDLRQNMGDYASKVARGRSFVVFKQTRPLFKIVPISDNSKDEAWEEVVDFTRIKKGGVNIDEILSRL
jgi:antitoxin (DNA-binding transcriptional repressor) of toxin-antitoxin stability system